MSCRVMEFQQGDLVKRHSLLEGLSLEGLRAPVVSFIGAGGKTTLISRLAEEYQVRGIPVIVTTTTHMEAWESPWFLLDPSMEEIKEVLKREGMVWLGRSESKGKMKSLPQQLLRQVIGLKCPTLIEADGAKRHPMKAPAPHEPVICPETTHVKNVYGLDALGKSLEKVCFRTDMAQRLLGKQKTDIVMAEDVVTLALDVRAGKKSITPRMSYGVVLNKADTSFLETEALSICRLGQKRGFEEFTVTAGGGEQR